jgi:hypothetical protein
VEALRTFRLIVGSGMLAQALMFLGTLVLSRCYGPAAFGQLGYFLGIASVVAVVCGLRFDYLVFAPGRFGRHVFFVIAGSCALLLHLAMGVLLVVLQQNGGGEKSAYWLLLFSFATSIFYLGTQLQVALAQYDQFARTRLIQACALIVLGLGLSVFGSRNGLFIAYAAPQLLVGLLIFSGQVSSLRQVSAAQVRACWQAYRRPAGANAFLVLMQYSTPFVPVLLGSLYFAPDQIGAYFLFSSAFAAPFAVFRRSLIHFLNAEMSTPAKVLPLARAAGRRGWLLAAAALAALAGCVLAGMLAEPLTRIVFGKNWVPYASLVLPVLVFFALDGMLQPFTTLLPLWGAQTRLMRFEAARFVGVFVLVPAVCVAWSCSFYSAMMMYFGVMLAAYLANIWAIWRLVQGAVPTAAAPVLAGQGSDA